VIQIRKTEFCPGAALVLGIFPCRVCSFQPPPPRLAKSLFRTLAHWAFFVNLTQLSPCAARGDASRLG